jgi:hypothetical protein
LHIFDFVLYGKQDFRAPGVGLGSNPIAALVVIALLAIFRFGGQKAKEVFMHKKLKKSKSKARADKKLMSNLASISNHIFETVWAVGASVAAAMAISTSIHWAGRTQRPALFCASANMRTPAKECRIDV